MQSRGARLGLLAAVVAVAVVLFIVLKDNDSDNGTDNGTTTANGGQSEVQVITVDNGEPTEGVKILTYDKGDQVQLEVRLNTPEEAVHVHGYEIEEPAEKSPVRLSFPANLDGVFEIELHEGGGEEVQIGELRVNP